MVNWREQTMKEVKTNSAKVQKKKSVLYFRLFKNNLQVAGKGTYNDFYINLVGGESCCWKQRLLQCNSRTGRSLESGYRLDERL